MKDIKWNPASVKPSKIGKYCAVYSNFVEPKFGIVEYTESGWTAAVKFWSEIPRELTDEELDLEVYRQLQTGGSERYYFLEGCKSARERERTKK
jgi:hypothetical protein